MSNRYRIFYKKGQELRYTANLDMLKIWERWMRRSEIPLSYSQGFHPQPRMNQAAPLPLGMLSDGEIVDIWVEDRCDLDVFTALLSAHPQPGIHISRISPISLQDPSIQAIVHHILYHAIPLEVSLPEDIEQKINTLLMSESLPALRRNKEYDLRPLILNVSVGSTIGVEPIFLQMDLLALPSRTGRPEEVISALGLEPADFRYIRKEIFFSDSEVK